jgi:hypothetical protein
MDPFGFQLGINYACALGLTFNTQALIIRQVKRYLFSEPEDEGKILHQFSANEFP